MPSQIDNQSISQVFGVAQQLESLGIIGVFFIMLCVAIAANYFLFKHAMANCGGMKEIYKSLESLSRAIEKTNETQRLSIDIIKEFSDRETKMMRESLERETQTIKEFFGNKLDALYSDSLDKLARIENAVIKGENIL
ncbi:hypothetical protein [Helicobacter sp.]|uniref:hypothetical protein n=1 Tax=Helicobacter sp. TaxID=218 RepID=UPI002A7568D7|nr:hypothetical protein [Helicobacter sp.]MDY2585456.1 hypothetical protein [Helicobacter sp.]